MRAPAGRFKAGRGIATYFRDSWRLSGRALALVRETPALLRLMLLGASVLGVLLAALSIAGVVLRDGLTIEVTSVSALVAVGVLAWIYTLAEIGVAGIADRALAGERATVRDGLALARERSRLAAVWAVVLVLVAIPARLVTRWTVDQAGAVLIGFTWNLLTFFAIPAIALDGCGPREAARRSLRISSGIWGRGAAGVISTWLRAVATVGLPGLAVALLGTTLIDAGPELIGAILLTAGLIAMGCAVLLGMATSAILGVAIYRYAERGLTEPFSEAELSVAARQPWRPVRWLSEKVDDSRVRRLREWVHSRV
ncbi:MAG TPA: DUF6159 family protein [Gemmatimonadales bacterium]|nr:DUF6159 family protein [Gemmatimonadales bacterium]